MMSYHGIAVLAAKPNQPPHPKINKMMTKCLFFLFALVAACSAGLAPVVPAALTVGTYASSYNAHAINHAYAAPYVAGAAPLAYAAPAPYAYSALPAAYSPYAPIIAARR